MIKAVITRASLLGLGSAVLLTLACAGMVLRAHAAESPPLAVEWHDRVLERWPWELAPSESGTSPATIPTQTVLPWSKLAFQSYRDDNWEVYTANDDGSGVVRLTYDAKSDVFPRLNRGCTRIAFAASRADGYEIFAGNADGSGLTRLTYNQNDDLQPVWSPDGTRIAFESYVGNQADVFVMNADGSGQTRLTSDAGYDGAPSWSPDGSRIAFTAYRNGGYRIWAMNSDGSGQVQLSSQAYSENPAWSPDGTQIAYDANTDGDSWQEVWVMNADGSNQHQVYDPPQADTDAWVRSWSPDGRYVAFTRVSFIYHGGYWYWTTAYLDAWDTVAGTIIRLSSQGEDWNPDWQTADVLPPYSQVEALPARSPSPFLVHWSGVDEGPAGIKSFDVQVRDGSGGAWTDWLVGTTDTSGSFSGVGGHAYFFRSRAWDVAGNGEAWPAEADASTTVEALAPTTAVDSRPAFARSGLLVTWRGSDAGGSGIKAYDVQTRDMTSGGDWTDWQKDTKATSAPFSGTPGHRYSFRSRGVDYAQNVENWPGGEGDACVALYTWVVSGTVLDNAGAPVAGALASVVPPAFASIASDDGGSYASYVADDALAYTVALSKAAYGTLPPTALGAGGDGRLDVFLPPGDNLVANGDFEVAEWGSSGWTPGGTPLPALISEVQHTGQQSALLGAPFEFGPTKSFGNAYCEDSECQDVAVDSGGTVHVVWSDGSAVKYSNKAIGGDWSAPEVVWNGGFVMSPKLAVDAADGLHVVWSDLLQIHYGYKPEVGGWQLTAFSTEQAPYGPDVAVDGAGTVHVVWEEDEIMYSSYDGAGNWSPPLPISFPPDEMTFLPVIGIDPDGTVHVLWQQYVHTKGWQILYAYLPAGGAWSTAVQMTQGPAQNWRPDMTVDDTGTLHAVWWRYQEEAGILYASKRGTAPWIQGEPVAPGSARLPTIASSHDGALHVVYVEGEYPDYNLWYRQKPWGGEWSAPLLVAVPLGGEARPRIAVDAAGNPHVFWADARAKYNGPKSAHVTSDVSLSQAVTVPGGMGTPALSFLYQLGGAAAPETGLDVRVEDEVAATTLLSATLTATGWTHEWFDLTPWAGEAITLTFRVREVAGSPQVWAYLDEVSLGTSYPDVWVKESVAPRSRPGDPVVFTLTYGNRGSAPAGAVSLTDALPSGLLFVSADPPPSSQTPDLEWDVGDLPAGSGPFTIVLTATVAPGTELPAVFANVVTILTTSAELEALNNTAEAELWIGNVLYLPLIARGW